MIFGVFGSSISLDPETITRSVTFRAHPESVRQQVFPVGWFASATHDTRNNGSIPGHHTLVLDGYLEVDGKPVQETDRPDLNRLDRLTGGFAAAWYDENTETLHLIRDPSGMRPMYYFHGNGVFAFASSPRILFELGITEPALDPGGTSHYLSMIGVPDPVTIYRNITSLPAGHTLRLHAGTIAIDAYHHASWSAEGESVDILEIRSQLRHQLEHAVSSALPDDLTRTGFFLSGGTDTTTVVGLASKLGYSPVQTFTIGYEGSGSGYQDYNEFDFARLVARKYRTDHHESVISPEIVKTALPGIVAALDQPSGDAINSYLVAQTLPESIDYVLTGTGGDEIFIGSHWYLHQQKLLQYIRKWQSFPGCVRTLASRLNHRIPVPRISRWIHTLTRLTEYGVKAQYRHIKFMFSEQEKSALLTPEFQSSPANGLTSDDIVDRYFDPVRHTDDINALAWLLTIHEVVNIQLRDLDVMCLAHGREARSPLMDHRVTDTLSRAPGPMKMTDGQLRSLMFDALQDVLPHETKFRKKMSFIVPMDLWARRELKPLIRLALSKDVVQQRGVFNWQAAAAILKDFETGREPHAFKVWNLALFELWSRYHIDHRSRLAPPVTLDEMF